MSNEPPSEANDGAARTRRGVPGVAVLAVVAVLGGLVGGLVVWLASGGSNDASVSRNGAPVSCASRDVAHDVLPSVVTVLARTAEGGGNGSGEIVRSDGYILTNDHVIAAAADGGSLAVRYSDGETTQARIVGRDPLTDLAVLQAEDHAEGRPLIGIGESSALQVGQPVVALGAPLGLSSTVTAGIVSALDRYVPVPAGDGQVAHLVDAVQTDASINPGNSGGPLVDCAGALVGVNTAIITVPNEKGHTGGGSVGLGFAIPSELATPLADQLIRTGSANHPSFGLQAVPIPVSEGTSGGLFVTTIDPGGPSETAGIQVGDVLTEVDGQPATSVAALEVATITRNVGDTVELTFTRDGRSATAEVTLAGPT